MAAARYRDPDNYLHRDITAYQDPRAIFANIPATSPTAATTSQSHATNGGYGDLESLPSRANRTYEEPRVSRKWSEGTNPYNWPMRPPASDPNDWPMKPVTGSPVVPAPPPKIPSTTFEIQTEDTMLPLRPWANKSYSSFGSADGYEDASVRPVPSMNSMTTVRPALYAPASERPVTSNSSSPGTSIGSPGLPNVPSLESGRPVSSRSMPPAQATTPGGRPIVPPMPSPPLHSGSSSGSSQSYPPLLNASIRPVASARPFITTHIRPLSPEGSAPDRTPVVEAGHRSPMPRSSVPNFSSTHSQASASPPPASPPPPYSNSNAAARRRTNSYYAMAQARSDQIMARSSPPPMPAHPAFRNEPASAVIPVASSPPLDRRSLLPSRSAASLPIEEPRPLSAALTDSSYMTDETMDSVTQAAHPASVTVGTASQQSLSSYPGARQYRPSSAASAPPEESRSRASSSSSVYSSGTNYQREQRSYSMATIMIEEDADELDLREIESAPAGIRRKPVPAQKHPTDTYKQVVTEEPASDSLKEVTPRSAQTRTNHRRSRETEADGSIMSRPRPRDMRKRFEDTTKEIVVPESELILVTNEGPSAPPPPLARSPLADSSKEIVVDTPIEPPLQTTPLPPPTSQVEMIRQRNLERKQNNGRRRLRIVNA